MPKSSSDSFAEYRVELWLPLRKKHQLEKLRGTRSGLWAYWQLFDYKYPYGFFDREKLTLNRRWGGLTQSQTRILFSDILEVIKTSEVGLELIYRATPFENKAHPIEAENLVVNELIERIREANPAVEFKEDTNEPISPMGKYLLFNLLVIFLLYLLLLLLRRD